MERFQVVLTTWSIAQTDEDDFCRVGEDQTVAQASSRAEADRIASEWAEAHADNDVSVSVVDLEEHPTTNLF